MSGDHTRRPLDESLRRLSDDVCQMGEAVMAQLERAVRALLDKDRDLAEQVIAADSAVDEFQRRIDALVLQTLSRQQPVAQDLRLILAVQRIAIDLERAGDHARSIARRALALHGRMSSTAVAQIGWLARRVRMLLSEALDAYRTRDRAKAEQVWASDVDLDIIYADFFQNLLIEMQRDIANIVGCTHLLFVAKSLERAGDHATNIAESVTFMVSGTPMEQPRPKGGAVQG
jgi:phosphate transport system protein